MGIMLKRQVLWRAIVTPQLREEVAEELQSAADEIDARIQQLEFSIRAYMTRVQSTDLNQALEIRRQIEAEKKRQETARDELLKQKEQVAQLENETEVVRGVMEGMVEVEVGDDLTKALAGWEVVTRDGKIVEVREVEVLGRRVVASGKGQGERGGQAGGGPGLIITGS